jgi:hypothetical protein
MTSKSTFEVTEKAGAFVAGQRNPGKDKPISLTEEQAFYPLLVGEIRRPGDAPGRSRGKRGDAPEAGE